jgi:hypothetical protein
MGRPKGSKNKSTVTRSLLNELSSQDEKFVEHENKKVLDVAVGDNDSDSDSDFELN